MATRMSCATGNWTSASTWAVIDSASYLNSQTGNSTPPSSSGATSRSSAFTPAASTIDGIAIKLCNRTSSSGTVTVALILSSDNSVQASTTIDVADLPNSTTAAVDGGWIFFKFSSGFTVDGATAYKVDVICSQTITLWRDSTGNNWARCLRTTTTGAPATGDDLIICGEHTGQGTGNSFTVTMNETAATAYGVSATSTVTPGLAICKSGTLKWNDASAGNPLLRMQSHVIVYNGGTLNIGTTGTPIPRDSVAILEFACSADGDRGLIARNGSTVTMQGLSRTSGKDINRCKLNTDEAIASTSLGVDTDTGWLDNDQIAVASTTRTPGQCEVGTLNGNAGASSLTVDGFGGAGGGLAYAHSGTSPTQAEIIMLTRNVRMRSTSSAVMTYYNCTAGSSVDLDWAEFYYMGENATGKRGFDISTGTAGSFNMHNCSLHDFEDYGIYISTAATSANITIVNNVGWRLSNVLGNNILIGSQAGPVICNSNIMIVPTTATYATYAVQQLQWSTSEFQDNVAAGGYIGFYLQTAPINFSGSNLTAHSCSTAGIWITATGSNCQISDITIWRSAGTGFNFGYGGWDVDGLTVFGCVNNLMVQMQTGTGVLKNMTQTVDSSFSTQYGLYENTSTLLGKTFIEDSTIISDASLTANNHMVHLRNVSIAGSITFTCSDIGYLSSQHHNQTDGDHRTWLRAGVVQTDAVIYHDAAPSMRMIPNSSSIKLPSSPAGRGILIPIDDGVDDATVSVYVRKSIAGDPSGAQYNGNQPRLIVRRDVSIGLDDDTVLDTMTVANDSGSWEMLSATLPTPTATGAFEVYVDCDGTTGWVNVDHWQGNDLKYWQDGLPSNSFTPAVNTQGYPFIIG